MQSNNKLPRWLQLILGVLFLPICLYFIIASIILLIESPHEILQLLFGSIALLGSIWITILTFRFIFNKQKTTILTLDVQLPRWVKKFIFFLFSIVLFFGPPFIFISFLTIGWKYEANFFIGIILSVYIIFIALYIWLFFLEKKRMGYNKGEDEIVMINLSFVIGLNIIFSSFVMIELRHFYSKPLTLDALDLVIAGSITGVMIIIVLVSYSFLLKRLNISENTWASKIMFGSPFIVILISFAILYYFFHKVF